MWFRHTRTRLVTAGAAFAALTAAVSLACEALDHPPSAPAHRSPARATALFGSGRACAQTRLVLGTIRPDGAPHAREGRFRAFTGQPPLGRPDMRAVPDRRAAPYMFIAPDGRRWWRGAHGAVPHRRPHMPVLVLPGPGARSRGAPGAGARRFHERWHGYGPVPRTDEPAPPGLR
ncbi:hypothetical protein [Streptomyces sp. TS71-3]|uniref:hypothetical protein n=1 Tax=Streptomyces sp. TS71-3 TaxID=2733862 RepID=UPI001B1F0B9D|nr:hypothetical protein [Streptomyces sp. TS71-3]GHJ39177.1 hypothetical protein Sm713_47860 [Streptomyces sp. TS71-3]